MAISPWKLRACAATAAGYLCLAGWAQTATSSAFPDSSRKFALLIGIDVYQPAGTQAVKPVGAPAEGRWAGGLPFPNLKGPSHDVAAIRALLTGEKYGFPNDDAHIEVLLNGQATHDAMLAAMQKVLVTDRKAGDMVVLYVSGHGSLRVNTKGTGAQFEVDGKAVPLENSLVPADGYKGVDDIYSSQLRRIYGDAANKGVRLTVIIDACHSGSLGRGADQGLVPRMIDYDPRDLATEEADDPDASRPAPESLPVNPVLVISAAQKDQSAMDVQDATPPHGLFTQALVEALEAMPASAPAVDVFRRVIVDMEINGSVNQQPALDSRTERKREPFFGGTAVTGELRASVVSTEEGTILLDTGLAADIGPGSTFIALVPDIHGVRTVLKVTGSEGVTRSDAVIVSPANGKVKPADVFERQVWVPAPLPKVKFYLGPGGLSQLQIADALAAVKQSGAVLAADPTGDAWTQQLSWNGKGWLLEKHLPARDLHARRPAQQQLGAVLRAADLKGLLPTGSVVWLDVPLPDELRPRVLQDKQASVESVPREQAAYVVGAVPTEDGVAYAWIEREGEDAELRTPEGMGAGCSPDLPMPLRTDFVPVPLAGPISEDTVAALNQKARDIARLSSWLHLEYSTDAESFPYSLGIKRATDGSVVKFGETMAEGEHFKLALEGSRSATVGLKRWVYVLAVNCQGKGTLLWPYQGPGGMFPMEGARLDEIPLPDSGFHVKAPLGTDTYLLLTTATQIAEPTMLEFKGVVQDRGGSRGAQTPLEELLDAASAGSRDAGRPTPTTWSVESVTVHSTSAKQD